MKKGKYLIFVLVAIFVVGGFLAVWAYLKNVPGNYFYNLQRKEVVSLQTYNKTTEDRCGIILANNDKFEQKNQTAQKCWEEAFEKCESMALMYIDESLEESIYSLLRIIGKTSDGQCVIQNMYYQKNSQEQPIYWVNTCSEIDSQIYKSCQMK